MGVIAEMGHVALQTNKFEESIATAQSALGLRETGRVDGDVFLSAANVHHELLYRESDRDAVDHIGLVAAGPAALGEVYRRVQDAGMPIVSTSPLEPGIGDGFAFLGPEDYVFEIYTGMAQNARQTPDFGPDRYGHINIHPQNANRMKDFLVEILDFRVSDVIGDDFAYFLRCNADHHGIAIIQGRGSMHHHAWQAQSIVDLGKLGDRLEILGGELIWGPVRHGAGHNIAAYYVEPNGVVVELYTDLEQIYDDERPPVRWEADDTRWFNRWGTYNGKDFRSHGIFPTANTIIR